MLNCKKSWGDSNVNLKFPSELRKKIEQLQWRGDGKTLAANLKRAVYGCKLLKFLIAKSDISIEVSIQK